MLWLSCVRSCVVASAFGPRCTDALGRSEDSELSSHSLVMSQGWCDVDASQVRPRKTSFRGRESGSAERLAHRSGVILLNGSRVSHGGRTWRLYIPSTLQGLRGWQFVLVTFEFVDSAAKRPELTPSLPALSQSRANSGTSEVQIVSETIVRRSQNLHAGNPSLRIQASSEPVKRDVGGSKAPQCQSQ
jgi:hypothetical protein